MNKILKQIQLLVFFVLVSKELCLAQSSSTVNGKNNQGVVTNNGTMNQYNKTVVSRDTERELKRIARHDFGSDRGWLQTVVPAHDPVVDNRCDVPKDALTIFLGKQFVASCITDDCKIIQDQNTAAVQPDLLSLRRKGKSLAIHAVVLDETGKIIAVMDDNKTHANPNNAFSWNRPDAHTIDIVDQYDRTVLHLRFANQTTVMITGTFQNSSGRSVEITDEALTLKQGKIPQMKFSGGCFNENQVAFAF